MSKTSSLTSPKHVHDPTPPKVVNGQRNGWTDIVVVTVLSAAALFSRLFRLDYPRVVVFDELFYSRFVHLYSNGIFFFDSNPPFAKQLIAALAYSLDYGKQNETFERIGDPYSKDTPVFFLRLVPALCGSLLVPLAYMIVAQLKYPRRIALLAAVCVLLDNALLAASRFVMTDSINSLFVFCAVWTVLKLTKQHPNSGMSILYGVLSGLFMGLAISSKYLSLPTLLWMGWLVGRHFCKCVANVRISWRRLVIYGGLAFLYVLVIPVLIYYGSFHIHLRLLTKAGPYDSVMSSKFQASLEGGLAAITNGQPYNVAYGSQITLRNNAGIKDNPCWLHSHAEMYPIFYEDQRGSSHQQQVTCYSYKDVNNWWIIKHPNKTALEVDMPAEFVKDGSVIQLVHGITGRLLNSHDVAAPLTPETQEVCAYIDYNISMAPQDLWRVKIINQELTDRYWHTIQTEVQLLHLNSSTSLSLSGHQLPAWGHHQYEIVSSSIHDKFTLSVWNVEEHRYTRPFSDVEEWEASLARSEFLPESPVKLSIWRKFLELQWTMLGLSRDTVEEHVYGSKPLDWVTNDNGVAFWAQKGTNRQIYQVGNNVVWQSGALCLMVVCLLLTAGLLVEMRFSGIFPVTPDQRSRISSTTEVLLGGFVINWLPYFFTDRTLFFHHYFPALVFKILILACFFGEILDFFGPKVLTSTEKVKVCSCCRSVIRRTIESLLAVWILGVVYTFYRFIPLTYGMTDLSAQALHDLEWRDSWNFIIRS